MEDILESWSSTQWLLKKFSKTWEPPKDNLPSKRLIVPHLMYWARNKDGTAITWMQLNNLIGIHVLGKKIFIT